MSTDPKAVKPGIIEIERHGDIAIIIPATEVETIQWELVDQAEEIVLGPLKREPASDVIVDLSRVSYFGSVFLSFLLRCHKRVKQDGGEMVLCGVSDRAKELLRLTALDTIWAIYNTREQALEALA
jgi:anti-anti-sigma factor